MSDPGMVRSAGIELPDPTSDDVLYNPSDGRLRELSSHLETTTEFGSPSYTSDYCSRCAEMTRNTVDHDFDADDYDHVERAVEAAAERETVCLDLRMGEHPEHTYLCRYYVPKGYARIGLALTRLFDRADDARDAEPDLRTVQIPETDETAIRVLPDEGFTAVVGTDYTGEAKKSFLRLFMYRVKESGGLGLHAGSKRVTLVEDGEEREVGQLFLGLSATGKSTLTAHGLGLEGDEEAVMLQDDVCGLLSDGTVVGSECNGLYVKTIGLDPDEQPEVYEAVTHESAVLENVDVADDGSVDFDSDRYTTNGRAAILRERLESAADDETTLGGVDQVFFITRNPAMPPVARLSPEEAAAAFMLGESIQTSAGDPSKAGESIRVVGTNPFIVGSEGEEGNRFRDLVAGLDVDCFLLNTGDVGGEDVGVSETVSILRGIARGTVEWERDDASGLLVPSDVHDVDMTRYDLGENVDGYEDRAAELRRERREYLSSFRYLNDKIVDAVY